MVRYARTRRRGDAVFHAQGVAHRRGSSITGIGAPETLAEGRFRQRFFCAKRCAFDPISRGTQPVSNRRWVNLGYFSRRPTHLK
jgi:hypothetical protein